MTETRVCLLGSFELVHDGRPVRVGGPVGMAILAVLAHPPHTKVLPDQLTTAVWGAAGAVTADNVYRHVTRLRQALAPTGLGIIGHRPGYRLPMRPEQVDAVQFDELLRTARSLAESDPDQAVERLVAALGMWSGPRALDNLTQPGIRRIATALDARRLDAEEELADLELRRGRPEIVLDRLYTLTATHPNRPRLTAALVRALHATGRTEEAVSELEKAENAARPGTVHAALATARHSLAGGGDRRVRPAAAGFCAVVPFQLPADTVHFTGRDDQLTRLLDLCPTHRDGLDGPPRGAVVIAAVEGMAGVGKTALAVRAAHQLADRFTDGVLFMDLRGFTPGVDPVTPEYALGYLLRGLGVSGDQVPPDLDTRTALYRTVLARRQVLIVLDNAVDETQIQPLLPSTPGCWLLVTSRRHLAGLDDAIHLSLPVLPPADAVALFRALVRDRATSADTGTIEEIVRLCGHLPLAIRIAAARLRSSRTGTPQRLLAGLTDILGGRRDLDCLSDGHRAVTAALGVSYRHLTADQQYAFRLLGVAPGPDAGVSAVARLLDVPESRAREHLQDLLAVHLVDEPKPDRFRMHDLVRLYAAQHAAAGEPAGVPTAALRRLTGYYLRSAAAASDTLLAGSPGRRGGPAVDSYERAMTWLETERPNLLALAGAETGCRKPAIVGALSRTLVHYLDRRGHHHDAYALHTAARAAAKEARNCSGLEAHASNALGLVYWRWSRYAQAAAEFRHAAAVARERDDRYTEGYALHHLAAAMVRLGHYQRAFAYHRRSQGLARAISDRDLEGCNLAGLGILHWFIGDYPPALELSQRGLAFARRAENPHVEAHALNNIGLVHSSTGRFDHAGDRFEQALVLARGSGNPYIESNALNGLGLVHRHLGDHRQARGAFQQALKIAQLTGNRSHEAEALNHLGELSLHCGDPITALAHHQRALTIVRGTGEQLERATTRSHLAITNRELAKAGIQPVDVRPVSKMR